MDAKQRLRERIWRLLDDEGASRFPGARGRIPNFRGAEAAATRLADVPEWEPASVVKSNPDAPQLPVRRHARRDGKTLYMAVPRLTMDKPFVRVEGDPTIKRALANLIDDSTTIATTVHPLQLLDEELPETDHDFRVDIVVTPDAVVRARVRRRAPGVIWEHLDDDKIAAISVLAARAAR